MPQLWGFDIPSLPTARRAPSATTEHKTIITRNDPPQSSEGTDDGVHSKNSLDANGPTLGALSTPNPAATRDSGPPQGIPAASQGNTPPQGTSEYAEDEHGDEVRPEDRSVAVNIALDDLQDDEDLDERHARTRWRRRFRSLGKRAHSHFVGEDPPDSSAGEGSEHFKVQHRYLPILSGLVCPFSVLLDIPGLTERWYVRTEGYNVIETQPNPAILDAGQAISIAFGILANIALISRFLERKPYLSTWIAIVGLTIHDLINICVVTIFGVVHRFADGFTYGTAYWMTVASTVASLVCNVTLVIDLVRTRDFKANGSGLTEKQRSLVIAVMCLLCYIGLGSLVYSFLESFSYIDSLYFTIVTITSVGFGDLTPTTVAAKVFSFFYDVCGLVLLAFTIAIARETVIETFEANYRARRDVLAKRARERKEEKRRRAKERRERLERQLRERLENPTNDETTLRLDRNQTMTMSSYGGGRGGRATTAAICKTADSKEDRAAQRALDFCEEREQGLPLLKASLRWAKRKLNILDSYTPRITLREQDTAADEEGTETATAVGSDAKEGRKLERSLTSSSATSHIQEERFKSFKQQLHHEQQNEFRFKLTIALSLFALFWTVGAAVFHLTEGWSYFNSLYFCFIFFTTIGYGDFSPKSSAGRAFFIAWALFGIANMTLTLSVVTETWSSRYRSSIHDGKTRRTLSRITRRAMGRDTSALRLLALEGFHNDEEIEPKDLPTKLIDAIRGFQDHARFFLLGRSGDVPENLRRLFDAASEFDDELESMVQDGQIEGGGQGDTRHFLFMVSYERQFDVLLDTAERLSQVFKSHEDELATMRDLNNQLRLALQKAESQDEEGEEEDEDGSAEEASPGLLPFEKRPPGGFGDEEVERELEDELDADDDDGDAVDDASSIGAANRKASIIAPASTPVSTEADANCAVEAKQTLRDSSALLRRLSTVSMSSNRPTLQVQMPSDGSGASTPTTPSRVSRSDTTPTTPILAGGRSRAPSTSGTGNLSMNRVPTLTFVEPERSSTPGRGSVAAGSSFNLQGMIRRKSNASD